MVDHQRRVAAHPEPDQARPPPPDSHHRPDGRGRALCHIAIGRDRAIRLGIIHMAMYRSNSPACALKAALSVHYRRGRWTIEHSRRSAKHQPGRDQSVPPLPGGRGRSGQNRRSWIRRPPVWARVWFRYLFGPHSADVRVLSLPHLVELEHIRTRIATDLHDDIGSSLSQIAILKRSGSRSGR